ncbi:flagellar filament capping protein FliD [Roseicyclus sp.]|uniref:flagellar filament capping protein FliD n=1 Tax=Roseicyclus sp. TaxID=1914329 RepID=UPI003F6A6943
MAVDYLSTLNSKGSGLNITQLVDSLTAAEVEPKRAQISGQMEKIELSISEMGKLRAGMESLRTTLAVESAGVAFDVASSSAAVSVAISDLTALENRTASVEVTALAQGQVLEFTGFASADAALGAGSLTLDFGSWNGVTFTGSGRASVTITLTNDAQGLDDLATQLSAISGVTAQVIAKGNDSYSLAVMTDTGAENALNITATAPADELLVGLNTTNRSNEVVAASDAALSVDGIAVTRSSNQIDDLLPGLSLTLNATTSGAAKVVALEDPDLAEAELRAFVEAINTTQSLLREATARGINGAQSGPLAADPAVAALSRNLAALTTTPLEGFGDASVFLSNLGVRTERDGSLSVDSTEFQAAMARDPMLYRAVFQSLNTSSSQGISVAVAGYGAPPAGAFTFEQTSDTAATLNGEAMIARTVDGVREFYKITGDFGGVTLRVTDPSPSTATVYFGESLIERLRNFVDDSLAASGDIALRTTRFEQDAREQEDLLDDLSLSESRISERYMARFGAMEAIVTQLKSTGDYLTSMLDAWNNSRD